MIAWVLLTGCSAPQKPPTDVDGDGMDVDDDGVSPPQDCDDGDSTVFPGADEIWYDGIDSDCDGRSDYDQDGDGYDLPPLGGDCDDLNREVGPLLGWEDLEAPCSCGNAVVEPGETCEGLGDLFDCVACQGPCANNSPDPDETCLVGVGAGLGGWRFRSELIFSIAGHPFLVTTGDLELHLQPVGGWEFDSLSVGVWPRPLVVWPQDDLSFLVYAIDYPPNVGTWLVDVSSGSFAGEPIRLTPEPMLISDVLPDGRLVGVPVSTQGLGVVQFFDTPDHQTQIVLGVPIDGMIVSDTVLVGISSLEEPVRIVSFGASGLISETSLSDPELNYLGAIDADLDGSIEAVFAGPGRMVTLNLETFEQQEFVVPVPWELSVIHRGASDSWIPVYNTTSDERGALRLSPDLNVYPLQRHGGWFGLLGNSWSPVLLVGRSGGGFDQFTFTP